MVCNNMCHKPEFEVFVGYEEMTAEMVIVGANGGVNGGANMFPQLYVDMYEATANHDLERLRPIQNRILEIISTIYKVGRYGSSYLKGFKNST